MRPAKKLWQGMRAEVIAPSGLVDPRRLERGCALLRLVGLEVTLGSHVLDRHPNGFLAGEDLDRAADLQRAWCDPEVDAIFCARGGYGAVQLTISLGGVVRLDGNQGTLQVGPRHVQ